MNVEGDLQILNDTTDRALFIRIKVQHPLWPDELVRKEIKNLRSVEFANWCSELFNQNQKEKNDG